MEIYCSGDGFILELSKVLFRCGLLGNNSAPLIHICVCIEQVI